MIVFFVAYGALALQRVAELVHARRNVRWLLAQGARFEPRDGFGAIVTVHVLSFAAPIGEALTSGIHYGWWSFLGGALFLTGEGLRYHAIRSLGRRWNTRVYVLPEAPLVDRGLYGRIRHPNYIGVALGLLGLPLVFGLWRAALLVSALNALALARRIRIEERALGISAGPRGG